MHGKGGSGECVRTTGAGVASASPHQQKKERERKEKGIRTMEARGAGIILQENDGGAAVYEREKGHRARE